MKAGTAQKMVLNMLSTTAMVRLGYVKGNRMTNMKASNEKLRYRGRRILMAETGLDENNAAELLSTAAGDLRVALVMHRSKATQPEAERALKETAFVVDDAVERLAG
jgi:N-acetylmuramic acid 6-phosphate etherase